MSTSEPTAEQVRNEAAFRRLIDDGFTRADLAAVEAVIAPDVIEHQDGMGAGPDGVKGAISFLHRAFPDFRLTVEDLTHDGDRVWARLRGRGTHLGPLMGRPPTGATFDITVIDICRFRDGQIVEHWGVPDRFTQMEQLGLLPTSPRAVAS
jgi:predicted ester cyclase